MAQKGIEQRVKIDHPTFKQYPDRGPGIAVSPAQKLPWEQINPIQAPNRMSTADKTAGTAGATETTPMPQGGSYPYPPSTQLPEAGEKVGDKTAPMPKLQVQGDPHNVYAVQDGFDIPPKVEGQPQPSPLGSSISQPGRTRTVIDDKWVDQSTNLDRIRAMLANKDLQRAMSLSGTAASLVPTYVDAPRKKRVPIAPELKRDIEIFGKLLANEGFTWQDFLVKHQQVGGKWVPTPGEAGGSPKPSEGVLQFGPDKPGTPMMTSPKEPVIPKPKVQSQRTMFDPNLYSNLRARGLSDAQVHQVQRLMTSTGLSADQLAMQGYLAMPTLAEEALKSLGEWLVKHPAGVTHYHGRKGRAYSTQTGMRIPEQRHVLAEDKK